MDTSIALFSMASLSSVRSVFARFNDTAPVNADPLKERVHTELTEGGEGTENGKNHMNREAMETSIALFSMASLSSVRSVSARFNGADPLNADPLEERVHTEFTEGGEGTKHSKSHMQTVRPWTPASRCSPWPHSARCAPCQRVSTTLPP
jgi:hypothetical protein